MLYCMPRAPKVRIPFSSTGVGPIYAGASWGAYLHILVGGHWGDFTSRSTCLSLLDSSRQALSHFTEVTPRLMTPTHLTAWHNKLILQTWDTYTPCIPIKPSHLVGSRYLNRCHLFFWPGNSISIRTLFPTVTIRPRWMLCVAEC